MEPTDDLRLYVTLPIAVMQSNMGEYIQQTDSHILGQTGETQDDIRQGLADFSRSYESFRSGPRQNEDIYEFATVLQDAYEKAQTANDTLREDTKQLVWLSKSLTDAKLIPALKRSLDYHRRHAVANRPDRDFCDNRYEFETFQKALPHFLSEWQALNDLKEVNDPFDCIRDDDYELVKRGTE